MRLTQREISRMGLEIGWERSPQDGVREWGKGVGYWGESKGRDFGLLGPG